MLFLVYVTSWQADSWKRVRDTVNGIQYLLNTNRLSDIRVQAGDADSGTSSLFYFDNPFDHRDSGAYMVLDYPVNDLIHEMDTALSHGYLTLNIYTNNDHTEDTTATEIPVAYFAYAVVDANDATGERSWVTYVTSGWDKKTVLVDNSLAELLAAVS